jgi:hypothetical protein
MRVNDAARTAPLQGNAIREILPNYVLILPGDVGWRRRVEIAQACGLQISGTMIDEPHLTVHGSGCENRDCSKALIETEGI